MIHHGTSPATTPGASTRKTNDPRIACGRRIFCAASVQDWVCREFRQEYGQAQPDELGIRLAFFEEAYCEQELLTISTSVTFMLPCSLLDFFTPVSWAMSFMSSFMLCAVELVTTPVAEIV